MNRARALMLRPAVLVPLLALLAVALFAAGAALANSPLNALDRAADEFAETLRNPALTVVFTGFTRLGNPTTMVILGLFAAAALAVAGRRDAAVLFALTMVASSVVSSFVKTLTHRVRPEPAEALIPLPTTFSFPSGHALSSGVFFGLLAFAAARYLVRPWAKAAGVAASLSCALMIGLSRVYLGVHWASDVIAGWLLAAALVVPATAGFAALERRQAGKNPPEESQPGIADAESGRG